jgi:hypothetical protein
MKNIFESAETFEAAAIIGACYFELKGILKTLDDDKRRSPLEILIDRATGFETELITEKIKNSIEILETIIQYKKILDDDFSSDEEFLDKLYQLTPPTKEK